jgi:hypothetical protein
LYAQVSTPRFSRRRRRNPAPAIIIAVVILLFGCWIFNLTCGGGEKVDTSLVTDYVNQVRALIDTSNSLSETWNSIKGNLAALMADPDGLDEQLRGVEEQCGELLHRARELDVPEGWETIHTSLLICLEQRYRAMKNYRPDIRNALAAVDYRNYVPAISEDLKELVYSDGSYIYFKRAATEALKVGGLSELTLPDSVWVADWEEVTEKSVESFLVSVRSSELHGLALGVVTLNPAGRVDENNVHHLPSTEEISVTVTVENQGNREEKEVPVSISLYSEADPTPVQQEQVIESIGAGQSLQVVFQGLRPAAGGVRNILEVKVGPVPLEAFVENNQKLIYFIVE